MDELEGIPSHLLGYNVTGRIRILFYLIIPTCLELLAYIIQMSADFGITFQHFNTNQHLFGGLTITFVCLPAIVSLILIILSPNQYPDTITGKYFSNIENWKFIFYQFFIFLIFPISAIYRFCRRIFWSIESLFYDKDMFERYHCVSKAAESSPFELYHFVQAYAQSAPQIILQLFILLRENIFRNYETSNIQIVSVIFSLINLSMITVTFQRFESQRMVGGRYLPWATFNHIQKHREKLQYSTEKIILPTAGKRQLSISLNNNKRHQQEKHHRSLHFPENDKIFHNFQLQISTASDTVEISSSEPEPEPKTLDETESIQVKNYYSHDIHGNNTTITTMNSSFTFAGADDDSDFGNLKNMAKDGNLQNYNNNEKYTTKYNNSNEEECLLFLNNNNNNEKILLAHTNCIDPISNFVQQNKSDGSAIDDTKFCLNITDDDKFLKNCQNINNNMNNNENRYYDDKNIEKDGTIITTVAEVLGGTETEIVPKKITSKENVKNIENLDRLQFVGTISENNSLMLNNTSQIIKNSNCKNRNTTETVQQQQQYKMDINEIVFIGEEMLNINLTKDNNHRHSSRSNIHFDQVPDLPAPPPPPSPRIQSTEQILPSNYISRIRRKNSIENIEFRHRQNEEQLNNFNPLNRISAFKDMIVLKAENYIVENLPHPPRYLIDKKNSTNLKQTKNYIQSKYSNDNNNKNNENIPDTVDFFLPKGRKTINGIEQDDFIGKFVAFFGWLMFIYMRMISLSVFSIFYLNAFFYILIIHYFIILLIFILSIKSFQEFLLNLKKLPIYIFLSYIYLFVILEFQIKFHKIRLWYGSYLFVMIIENFIITIIWYEYCEFESWWFEYIIITIIGSGLLFISCMIVYYYLLRPNDVMLLDK